MEENNDKNISLNANKSKYINKNTHITCNICGSRYHKVNKNKHLMTKKHLDCEYLWKGKFAIK